MLTALALGFTSQTVFILDHSKLTPAEQVIALTAQGLANQRACRVWMRAPGMSEILERKLPSWGYALKQEATVWDLIRDLGPVVKGGIAYKLNTASLNAASSYCASLGAVAVDESVLDEAKRHGLTLLQDLRTSTRGQSPFEGLAPGILFEQALDKPGHLRDLAVARHAFIFSTDEPVARKAFVREMGPNAVVYGWGSDEFKWISDISKAGGTGVAADWSLNLSAMQHLPGRLKKPAYARVAKSAKPHRTVAFVVSDGDNIQWLGGNFALDTGFWASPQRGKFPVSWEIAPVLADVAPPILDYLYRTATPNDDFVTGPGLPGYTFLHDQPNAALLVPRTKALLRSTGLRVVSTLNRNEGEMSETAPFLRLPEVDGAIYKDYSPYNRRNGEIWSRNGKVCLAYRFVLWNGLTEIPQLVDQVKEMSDDPRKLDSFALVNVHAWSFRDIGGPMEAIARAIKDLPDGTRVVSASQLLKEVTAVVRKNPAVLRRPRIDTGKLQPPGDR